MDLNSFSDFGQLDKAGMYQSIIELPEQLESGYSLGGKLPLPGNTNFRSIIISGMGGSAIAADLINGCFKDTTTLPVLVNREYHLPGWATGNDVLVVCSSHSGNTEETLSAYRDACDHSCTPLVITTGGKISQFAQSDGHPLWKFEHQGQPRAAIGWSFGLLLALFTRLKFIPNQEEKIVKAVNAMQNLINENGADVAIPRNPAKRLAGQLVGKYVTLFGAEHLMPVARRWKTQVNELAKCWCQFEEIPEANHNTIAGTLNPEKQLLKIFSIFLQSPHYSARNQQRVDLTFTELMVSGIGTDKIFFRSNNRFTDMWVNLLFGDLVAYYLSILNDVDPTPVDAIESFKGQLGQYHP